LLKLNSKSLQAVEKACKYQKSSLGLKTCCYLRASKPLFSESYSSNLTS